jgi:chromodomain-helicase-DNA-binding protein 7
MNDISRFTRFEYGLLTVDEAHRLKNVSSKLKQALDRLTVQFRLLLMGAPLENTIVEMKALLKFLNPDEFQDIPMGSAVDAMDTLRERLESHVLRRLKVDVDSSNPEEEETIIECSMTRAQKQFYRAVLERNAVFLFHGTNLANVAMELRNVCQHPYLINGADETILGERGGSPTQADRIDCLIHASGKMILLDKLLGRLSRDGHRVLLTSQMVRLLDIIQNYLTAVNYTFVRIDGSVIRKARQQLIDGFNSEGSDTFVLLLCTRAGRINITLNVVDTVIIFDGDVRTQHDIRTRVCYHRIGQRKALKVFRLLSKGTYEEQMFEIASPKLGLGHAVLRERKATQLDHLLRRGAYHMLNNLEGDDFGDEDIDQILSRSTVTVFDEAAGSSFSKASFVVGGDYPADVEGPDFWLQILLQAGEKRQHTPARDGTHTRRRERVRQRLETQSSDSTKTCDKSRDDMPPPP